MTRGIDWAAMSRTGGGGLLGVGVVLECRGGVIVERRLCIGMSLVQANENERGGVSSK